LRDQILTGARRAHDQRRNVGHVPVDAVAIASQVVGEDGMPGLRPQLGDGPGNPEHVAENIVKRAANLEEEGKRRRRGYARGRQRRAQQPLEIALEGGIEADLAGLARLVYGQLVEAQLVAREKRVEAQVFVQLALAVVELAAHGFEADAQSERGLPAQVAQPDHVRALAMELLARQVCAIGRPDGAGLGEGVTQRDALALDAFGREWIVVGDAGHRTREPAFLVAKQHVRGMYIDVQRMYIQQRAAPQLPQ
jgi:hypothetical protein